MTGGTLSLKEQGPHVHINETNNICYNDSMLPSHFFVPCDMSFGPPPPAVEVKVEVGYPCQSMLGSARPTSTVPRHNSKIQTPCRSHTRALLQQQILEHSHTTLSYFLSTTSIKPLQATNLPLPTKPPLRPPPHTHPITPSNPFHLRLHTCPP
jgi:hypothetical protein